MGEPRAVIEQLVRCINDRDGDDARTLVAPDARLVTASGAEVDVDGLIHGLLRVIESFPDVTFRVDRFVCDGEFVCSEEVLTGTHERPFAGLAATGKVIELPMLHLSRVVEGRIVERVSYHDTAGFLRRLSGSSLPSP